VLANEGGRWCLGPRFQDLIHDGETAAEEQECTNWGLCRRQCDLVRVVMQNLGLTESIGEYLGDGDNTQLETVGDWRFFYYSENECEHIRVYSDVGAR